MSVCPNCGVGTREGKAFCYNCGEPTSPLAARRDDRPTPELFESTVAAPRPQRVPQPPTAPPPGDTPPRPAPGSVEQRQQAAPPPHMTQSPPARAQQPPTDYAPPAQYLRPAPEAFAGPAAPPAARRKFSYGKFGLGVVLLLLLVIVGIVALAILSD